MEYKKIIADSWRFTQSNKKLIYWFGFFPALLTTTVGMGYVAYQFFAFRQSHLFQEGGDSFFNDVVDFGWSFIQSNTSLSLPIVIALVVLGVIWFLLPTLFKASAIQAIARAKNGQKSGVGVGLRHGILSFLPLLEYHMLTKTFSWISMLTESSFVVRNLGVGAFKMMLPVFVLIFVLSIFLTLLFTFADFYIVIDGHKVLASMRKSAKLVIMNWQHTLLVTILMIIIGVRIVIQAFFVFLIPALVVLLAGYLTTIAIGATLFYLIGAVAVLALLIAAYLNGVVDIFVYTVWTYTFLALTSEKELDARGKVISAREIVSGDDVGEIETAPRVDVRKEVEREEARDQAPLDPTSRPSDDNIPGLL
jgi:hypothetical protein